MEKDYTIQEHVHRYACWTAARAASISRFSNNEISQFILENDLRNDLDKIRKEEITSDEYKKWFVEATESIYTSMKHYVDTRDEKLFRNISFGIAAKVVSIYVKTSEIIPSGGLSPISKVAIPPVDSYLLKGLKIKTKPWSTLNKEEYMTLVHDLEERVQGEPFWKLEFYWNLSNQ
jgi:hypothetical protein